MQSISRLTTGPVGHARTFRPVAPRLSVIETGRSLQCARRRRRVLSECSAASHHANANAAYVEEVKQTTLPSPDSISEPPEEKQFKNPPTYLTTTGRIVASKYQVETLAIVCFIPHTKHGVMTFLCAVGDLHGDWKKAIESFAIAKCIRLLSDGEIEWIGGDTVVVQLGDVLDRGDNEIGELLLLFLMSCLLSFF